MRRASSKKKPTDTRQFDLFAMSVPRPTADEGADTMGPLSKDPSKPAYEAEVLDVLVGLLNRQWAGHLSSSGPPRGRPAR